MAVDLAQPAGADQPLAGINTTPLVDVMLVLLIIFLVTIPVVNFSRPVQLPVQATQPRVAQPQDIVITIDAQARMYWLDAPLRNPQELTQRLQELARQTPQPAIHIRADGRNRYAPVGRVVHAAQQAGILSIGFLTEPGDPSR